MKQLGDGTYGSVWKAINRQTNDVVRPGSNALGLAVLLGHAMVSRSALGCCGALTTHQDLQQPGNGSWQPRRAWADTGAAPSGTQLPASAAAVSKPSIGKQKKPLQRLKACPLSESPMVCSCRAGQFQGSWNPLPSLSCAS